MSSMALNTVKSFVWKLCSIRLRLFYFSLDYFQIRRFGLCWLMQPTIFHIPPLQVWRAEKPRTLHDLVVLNRFVPWMSLWFISFLLAHLLAVIYFTWKILHLLRLFFCFYCTNVPWSSKGTGTRSTKMNDNKNDGRQSTNKSAGSVH